MQTIDVKQRQRRRQITSGRWSGNPRHIGNLDISPADDGYMVYRAQLDRVTFLNSTAALILELCDGENSPEQIADLVKQAYSLSQPPVEDVRGALKQLMAEGLLQ